MSSAAAELRRPTPPRDFTAARLAPRRTDQRCDQCSALLEPGIIACARCGEIVRESSLIHDDLLGGAGDVPFGHGVVDGQWQLLQKIGESARTSVWEARDIKLDRIVAVKLMHEGLARSAAQVDRFEREVRLLARHEHACLLPVFGLGRMEGRPFFVTRLVVGSTLEERLASSRGGLPLGLAAKVVTAACDALGSPHEDGIVHGRLSPRSLVLCDDGRVTLLDLGRSRGGQRATGSHELPAAEYLAPEQLRGEPLDPRTDVYALGCVLHEVLTGRPPFSGSRAEVMEAHLSAARAAPAGLPEGLGELVVSMLSPAREARPPLSEVRAALRAVEPIEPDLDVSLTVDLALESVQASTPTRVIRRVDVKKPQGSLLAIAYLATAACCVFAMLILSSPRPEPRPVAAPPKRLDLCAHLPESAAEELPPRDAACPR